ncbi:MAG: hypothetical protein LUG89_03405 [Methanosphaera sp.]|nr:hypothetical protein [Methanosphaera sp.]
MSLVELLVSVSLVELLVSVSLVSLSLKFRSGKSNCMNADATTPHSIANTPTTNIIIIFEFVCALILSTLLFIL